MIPLSKKLYKLSGVNKENNAVTSYVLFKGYAVSGIDHRLKKKNIERLIRNFKKKHGAGSPREFVKYVNQHAMYLDAEILNDPVTLGGLEHTEDIEFHEEAGDNQ